LNLRMLKKKEQRSRNREIERLFIYAGNGFKTD
jgi:hypothetical protein